MLSWLSWTAIYYISEWAVRLVMTPVVTSRRSPNSAMAWLLVIFFLPWPGLVLYLLIGENRLPQRRIAAHKRLGKELLLIRERFRNHPNIEHPRLGPEQEPVVALAERLGSMPILGGNDIELLAETEDVIDRLISDIDAAQHNVHLLFYIYADDETGRRVARALYRAVERGVPCRVLVDAVGSRPLFKTLASEMRQNGVQLCASLPVSIFRRRAARLDLRNHRKLAVIDGAVAYAGSQNIVDASYGHKDLAWHDMMVRLTGPLALELQAVFVSDWYFDTSELLDGDDVFVEPRRTGAIAAQTLPSGPNYPVENYQRLVVAALHAAHSRVIITTPYFVPDEALFQAVQVAVMRGVRVDLILPRRSDQILVGAASRAYYDDMLRAGVHVYLYTDGLLHSKIITIDDGISLIGSSNFDIRSFALNFELNLLLYGPDVTSLLREQQERYVQRSVQLTLEEWAKQGVIRRVCQNMVRLLSPLL